MRLQVRLGSELIPTCISTCFILHNLAKHLQDPDFEDEEDVYEEEEEAIAPVIVNENDQHIRNLGRQRRQEVALALID